MLNIDNFLVNYVSTQERKEVLDVPREVTEEEWELLNDHVNNNNLQAIYDYYDLKDKLDKDWIDGRMWHKLNPYG